MLLKLLKELRLKLVGIEPYHIGIELAEVEFDALELLKLDKLRSLILDSGIGELKEEILDSVQMLFLLWLL